MQKFLLLLFSVALLASCSKETSLENGTGTTIDSTDSTGTGGDSGSGSGSGTGTGSGTTDPTGYYLQCKVDGTLKTFDTEAYCTVTPTTSASMYDMSGYTSDENESFDVTLTPISSTAVKSGTTYTLTSSASTGVIPMLIYIRDLNNISSNGTFTTATGLTSVSVTELSSTVIGGTFKATLTNYSSGSNVEITEGKFRLEIQ